MTSYNKVIGIFQAFADAHEQLKGFAVGDPSQVTDRADVTYPFMYAVPVTSPVNIETKEVRQTFKVLFFDLKHEDESNESELMSDMQAIAFDFLSQLQLPEYGDLLTVVPNAQLDPLSERINEKDSIAGWQLTVGLRVDYLSDWCGVPSTLNPSTGGGTCQPVNVYDSAGTLIATVASGGTVTIANSIITDSSGKTLHSVRAQQTQSISDSKVKKADGVTDLLPIPAEGSKTTTQVLAAMSGSEIVADIETNGGAQKTYVAANYATRFTETWNFAGGSDFRQYVTINETGTFDTEVSKTNTSSYVISLIRNGSISVKTLPFTVQPNDYVQIVATPVNSANDGSVTLKGTFSAQSNSSTYRANYGGDGKIWVILCKADQTVYLTDCSTIDPVAHTSTNTIVTLPSGKSFASGAYRATDKCAYFFGNNYWCKIDADPSSGTYGTITAQGSLTMPNATSSDYSPDHDIFLVGSGSNNLYSFNPAAQTAAQLTFGYTPPNADQIRYMPALKGFSISGFTSVGVYFPGLSYIQEINMPSQVNGIDYNYANGLIYIMSNAFVYAGQLYPFLFQKASISTTGADRGALKSVTSLNRIFCTKIFTTGAAISVIDSSTNTSLGNITPPSYSAGANGLGDIIYSPNTALYSGGIVGIMERNGNRVHIIDPSQALASMYKGYITVGNLDTSNTVSGSVFNQGFINRLNIGF